MRADRPVARAGLALGACLAFTLAALGPVAAQPSRPSVPLGSGAAGDVMGRMDQDARLRTVFERCPADAYRRAAGLRDRAERASMAQCAAEPASCYDACTGGSGSACFSLARAFQENEATVPPRYTQMLFSMSCAAGYPAGCTNRASSIRNSLHPGDPFQRASEKVKNACQFRSFQIACRGEDPWGCSMLGQSYQYGEGVGRSVALARGAFMKSCRLNPDFEACAFAKDGLKELAPARPGR